MAKVTLAVRMSPPLHAARSLIVALRVAVALLEVGPLVQTSMGPVKIAAPGIGPTLELAAMVNGVEPLDAARVALPAYDALTVVFPAFCASAASTLAVP